MRWSIILKTSSILMLLTLTGCFMYPYTGGWAYFPDGSDENTAQYLLSIKINGAYRHAYNDLTKKDIYVSLKKKDGPILMQREYSLHGAGLHWDVSWSHLDNLKIVFYDEQGLIRLTDRSDLTHLPRQIFTINFTFDPSSGKFIESFAPDNVISKIRSRLERTQKTHVISLYLRMDANDDHTLDSLRKIASEFNLTEKPVPNCMNCFAYFVDKDFEMKALRIDNSEKENLVIEVIDWEKKELSKKIVASLNQSLEITRIKER